MRNYLPSFLDLVNFHDLKISTHDITKGTQQFDHFLLKVSSSNKLSLPLLEPRLTLTTSTGSFFMLFGQVSSGLFSGSPGRRRILRRFLTSSMRCLAAFESSRRSLRTIRVRGASCCCCN